MQKQSKNALPLFNSQRAYTKVVSSRLGTQSGSPWLFASSLSHRVGQPEQTTEDGFGNDLWKINNLCSLNFHAGFAGDKLKC